MKKTNLVLALILITGAFLRFYKLDWGEGLFTHPDEYHIVASVMQLSFPNQMNPHFFSYGTVTIYLIYFTKELLSLLLPTVYNLSPFLIGRFYSAFFSTLTILLIYKISKTFLSKNYALLAAALVALTPGLIQQAHFATPESNLIFFLFGSLLFLLNFMQTRHFLHLFLSSLFLGLSLAVKISGAVFAIPLLLALLIISWPSFLRIFKFISLFLILTALFFLIGAPFVFLDFPSFKSNFDYEGGLAAGKIAVFYTRQFIDTQPILFQLEKIYPFTLGPALLIFGLIGFFISFYILASKIYQKYARAENWYITDNALFLTLIAFFTLFFANSFLFAKWTRFISPTFPFFAIFSAFFLFQISKLKINKYFPIILNSLFIILTTVWTLAFFSIYIKHDVRITASDWIETSIPVGSSFLVEGGNMVDIPLKGDFKRVSLDFYNLDQDSETFQKVLQTLDSSDYFIVQSRRVFLNHQRLPNLFPQTAQFYDKLFKEELGFTQVKEFNSYPNIKIGKWSFDVPDETAEETWSVFDHPVIRVFKKIVPLTTEEYTKALGDE